MPATPPVAAATFVTRQAFTARAFAPRADPPLNPNQPIHKSAVPRITLFTLLGSLFKSTTSRADRFSLSPGPAVGGEVVAPAATVSVLTADSPALSGRGTSGGIVSLSVSSSVSDSGSGTTASLRWFFGLY